MNDVREFRNRTFFFFKMSYHSFIHGREVNMLKRATDLAPTNVGGTAAVLSFAALAAAPVVFTSTVQAEAACELH